MDPVNELSYEYEENFPLKTPTKNTLINIIDDLLVKILRNKNTNISIFFNKYIFNKSRNIFYWILKFYANLVLKKNYSINFFFTKLFI